METVRTDIIVAVPVGISQPYSFERQPKPGERGRVAVENLRARDALGRRREVGLDRERHLRLDQEEPRWRVDTRVNTFARGLPSMSVVFGCEHTHTGTPPAEVTRQLNMDAAFGKRATARLSSRYSANR